MKLLVETIFGGDMEFLEEAVQGSKAYRIKGVFAQAEVKNGNSRIYPKTILENQVNDYVSKKVLSKQSLGELGHNSLPFVNIERASHLIESLQMVGNDVIGVAKILDTPCGRIVKSILSEGVRIGVSTRGLGTVGYNGYVNDDFRLCTVDIVSNPSAPKAIMDTIMESKEYIINGDEIFEKKIESLKESSAYKDSAEVLKLLRDFLKTI